MTDSPGDATGFVFPCRYAVKAMGLDEPGFDELVVGLVRRHCPDITEGAVTSRASRGGRYISITIEIEATSRAQLDAIYAELTSHEKVLMRL